MLGSHYASLAGEPQTSHWTFYDTFDWRLHRRSLLLRQSERQLVLEDPLEAVRPLTAVCSSAPSFVWAVPAGALRDRLQGVVGVRALLPLADVAVRTSELRILNRDEKTVTRVTLLSASLGPDVDGAGDRSHVRSYVTVRPVRGYPRHARRVTELLSGGTQVDSVAADVLHAALQLAGEQPDSYSSKLDLDFSPDTPSAEAARSIMLQLLEVMRANEAGLKADIDTEFLHDFRIAVRKTRSALGQIVRVFPSDATERFKRDFRWLGSATNRLRDLDVYLLAEQRYKRMLPPRMRSDIAPLFAYLRAQRVEAHREVAETLESGAYRCLKDDWAGFLLASSSATHPSVALSSAAPNAAVPIGELASRRIYKRYRQIVKNGTRIVDEADDERLHALRIECKKLRYLLEFFGHMFPRKAIKRELRQLKRLQDNLGAFTDLAVQQEYLLAVAQDLPLEDPRARHALVATGVLVETLARRQAEVRSDFARTFGLFASDENQATYRALFKNREA
jgi:CHAD domain-containing protein